ncbi:MAG: hypothetical protein MUC83_03160 [Pirellula sp.]|nr:hypothetical protein [Pirellula sp.]
MEIQFKITEPEAIAFAEQFHRDSGTYRRLRNRTRWVLPLMLVPLLVIMVAQFGFRWSYLVVFPSVGIAWIMIAPRRFDARVKRYMQKQYLESSAEKAFGEYKVKIDERCLISQGPTGYTEYRWDSVDRVLMSDEFLFLFLAGPAGLPIRITDIGELAAKEAYEKIQSFVAHAKQIG